MNITAGTVFQRLFIEKKKIRADLLKKWNMALAVLFVAQGVAVLLFGTAHDVPVNVLYLTSDMLQSQLAGHVVTAPAIHQLFAINVAYLVTAMLFAAALGRAYVATVGRSQYEAGLKRGLTVVRWMEYAVSGSTLVLAAGLLAGVYDAGSLVFIVGLTVVGALSGMTIDVQVAAQLRRKPFSWIVPVTAVLAGLVVWTVIGIYACSAHAFGSISLGGLTYGALASGLLGFVAMALNTHLSDTKKGRWADYAYGEGWYMGISFVGASAFAWLIFMAVLHP